MITHYGYEVRRKMVLEPERFEFKRDYYGHIWINFDNLSLLFATYGYCGYVEAQGRFSSKEVESLWNMRDYVEAMKIRNK